jgi:uncharacterized protein YlxW (UPF0749 family)
MVADLGRTPTRTTAPAETTQPPQVWMGLLDYVTSHSLDEDYAHVSQRKAEEASQRNGDERTAPATEESRSSFAGVLVMVLFGLLVVTAAVQTSRNAADEATGRETLVNQIRARSAQVDVRRQRVADLRREVQGLQSVFLEATAEGRGLSARLSRLGVVTGSVAVTGPGVKVVVDDNPNARSDTQRVLDEDLQKLANALWVSGAEAISVNGQRLSALSAIRGAGDAITVNFKSLSAPYTVLAIGNPNTMLARFVDSTHGSEWFDLQAVHGLQFHMTSEESLRVPANTRLDLRHATPGRKR